MQGCKLVELCSPRPSQMVGNLARVTYRTLQILHWVLLNRK